jgi:ABC-2 type transport system permease protein
VSKALAFILRDLRIQRSYRLIFLIELVYLFLGIVPYYFLARFIGPSVGGTLAQYGGNYFSFALIGIVLQQYFTAPLTLFSRQIRESQLNGTLESLLSTQTPLSSVIVFSALYPFVWATMNVVIYVVVGMAAFGLRFGEANWFGAALVLIFSLLVFCGIGILSASFILVFKRGDPLTLLIGAISWIFAGVLYPVSVLPSWLRGISALLPVRYAIDGMRGALLQNASWTELWMSLGPLALFAALTVPLGLVTFHYAHRWVRITGSLADY